MSTAREFQIPVIMDITAETVEHAAESAVFWLAQAHLPGRKYGNTTVESWWTVEEVAKPFDGNDNDNGIVLFQNDLDYLYNLMLTAGPAGHSPDPYNMTDEDIANYERLLHYLKPGNRCGSSFQERV